MLLKDSQRRSSKLSKNRCRINIQTIAREHKRNIQSIPQCYTGNISETEFPDTGNYRTEKESFQNVTIRSHCVYIMSSGVIPRILRQLSI